ncbi:zinc-binding dehydrogenase [Curtobacterium sp. MCLR17_034]|uniref:zinc-binding dehydrogenase n=1 Tax=Curtobacterium sp. MCLR17_034 TaxID=2175623 RepID=UPI000DA9E824|nr:zinc-binding dehydrogenase [Curtobacterium sp. MCLR17_034]PZF10430.1 NADPH:quinone reductase [Curtobacterium sp. MCLR17_034]
MRAMTVREFGAPSGMELVDLPAPKPEADQVVIRTDAMGIGGVDAVIRRGTLGGGYPSGMILGSEVAGTIVEVGADVDQSRIGQRVWAFTGTSGGYAELAVAHIGDAVALPDGIPSTDAVALGSAATVAHFALAHAHAGRGDRVLVRGAAGSIGIAAIELTIQLGAATVAVTTSSPDRGRRLQQFGATHVLDRAGHGDAAAPTEFDVIVDIAGGPAVPDFIDRLAPNGRMVLVGAVSGFPPADFGMRLMQSFQKSRSVATFSLASIDPGERDMARFASFEAAVRGDLHPVIDAVMPLGEAATAHQRMDDGDVFGRIVLIP